MSIMDNVTDKSISELQTLLSILESFPKLSLNSSLHGEDNGTWNHPTKLDINDLPEEMTFNDSHIITIIAYACLMLLSAIGNISVLKSLSNQNLRSSSSRVSLLIRHLAIADMFVTFLLMPLEIGWAWTVSWRAGDFLCRMMAFFRTFGVFLSGFVLVAISVDRYQSVLHPLTVTEAKKKVRRMLWISWFLSVMFSFPQAIIFHVEKHPIFTWFEQCVTFNSFNSVEMELAYYVSGFVAMYAIPLAAILFCYGSIVWAIFRSVGKRQNTSLDRAKTKTLNMTLTIVLAFFFCWTPYNIMSLWYFIDKESARLVDRRVQASLFIFAVANSTVNPMVYGYFNCSRRKTSGKNAYIRRIVYKPPFRQHLQLCRCNAQWSSSSDTPLQINKMNEGELQLQKLSVVQEHTPIRQSYHSRELNSIKLDASNSNFPRTPPNSTPSGSRTTDFDNYINHQCKHVHFDATKLYSYSNRY